MSCMAAYPAVYASCFQTHPYLWFSGPVPIPDAEYIDNINLFYIFMWVGGMQFSDSYLKSVGWWCFYLSQSLPFVVWSQDVSDPDAPLTSLWTSSSDSQRPGSLQLLVLWHISSVKIGQDWLHQAQLMYIYIHMIHQAQLIYKINQSVEPGFTNPSCINSSNQQIVVRPGKVTSSAGPSNHMQAPHQKWWAHPIRNLDFPVVFR